MKKLRILLLLTILPATMGNGDGGCSSPPILEDDGFDLWCGNQLCYWTIESGPGYVAKQPTWHKHDYGIGFNGSVSISQATDSFASCMELDYSSYMESPSQIYLQIDVEDNGSIDKQIELVNTEWDDALLKMRFAIYSTARFYLKKAGAGTVTLAQVRLRRADDCSGPLIVDGGALK